jgi:DNA polymerase III subunit epsilon
VLASPGRTGRIPFAQLLASARRTTFRIWATDSPYDSKEQLKARNYRWSDGTDGRRKSWYVDVEESAVRDESAWLEEHTYEGRRHSCPMSRLTATDRYSNRG